MGKELIVLAAGCAFICGVAWAQPYDGPADCERYATAWYKARNSEFKTFAIDRKTVEEIAYEEMVGSQHVTAIFRGRATYTGRRRQTGNFICLHAGSGKGALFVYLFPS